jgi:hypothetical protein
VFVDEIDKADVDVKKVIGEAALSGRLGPHKLPKGWQVWMAGNSADDRSGSTKELNHLINRQQKIVITDDLNSLVDWMNANGASALTKAFAESHPDVVFEAAPKVQGPWCTPRSLMGVDAYLRYLEGIDVNFDDPLLIEEIGGMIGVPAANALAAMIQLQAEMPKYEAIVAGPMKAKIPVNNPAAEMLICYNLAARVSKDDADPVLQYVGRLRKEMAVTFAKSATQRDKFLLTTPVFNKWCMTNASLMAAIAN